MTTFIATLGFDSTRVTRPVLTHGLEEQDRIVLVRPAETDAPRAEEAREDIRRMVTELHPDVTIETLEFNPGAFHDGVRHTARRIDDSDDVVVLVLGGGARDIYLPVAFTAFIRSDAIDTILQFSDITGSVSELDIPNFLHPPGPSTVETLETIVTEDGGVSLTIIADILDIAKSTVARHVTELEAREFVHSEMNGKRKIVYPTKQGRLAVDVDAL
jgi:CRISPR-associated protein Csa3